MRRKKKLYIALGIIQLITAIGAIPAGIMFIAEPSGKLIGMTTEMLTGSPFDSFFLPGLFLLVVNGIGNLTGSFLSFLKSNIAGQSGILLGIMLSAWIVVQVFSIGLTSWMQPVFFGVGIAEILLGIAIYRNLKKHVLPKKNL